MISDYLFAFWPNSRGVENNWGDKFCPVIVNLVSKRPVIHTSYASSTIDEPTYRTLGSSLALKSGNHIWGTGFIREKSGPEGIKHIFAVRGPHSRQKLLAAGFACPKIYGDPALLLPLFYHPSIRIEYDIGVIYHWREGDVPKKEGTGVLHIDITGGLSEVVDQILSCRRIVSSSLHGLIVAHAYGVPASWINVSDKPIGDGFKFKDYFASMGCDDVEPIPWGEHDIEYFKSAKLVRFQPLVSIPKLIRACPFIEKDRKHELCVQAKIMLPSLPRMQCMKVASSSAEQLVRRVKRVGTIRHPPSNTPPLPLLSAQAFSSMLEEQARMQNQITAYWPRALPPGPV